MHIIERDSTWRGPSEAVAFNRECNDKHDLAVKLEKQGIITEGVNTSLYGYINLGERFLRIIPSWRYDGYWRTKDGKSDPYDVNIEIPSFDVTIPAKLDNIKKVFSSDGYLMKAIKEYEASLHAAKLAFANNIKAAQALDEV